MKVNAEAKNRYLYEYAFWDVVDKHNHALDDKSGVVRTSEARAMRKRLDEILKENDQNLGRLPASQATSYMNEVFKERLGYEPYAEDRLSLGVQLNSYIKMTGFGSEPEVHGDQYYVPISPYDPRFEWRSTIREQGSKLSSVRVSDVEDLGLLANPNEGFKTEVFTAPELRTTRNGDFYTAEGLDLDLMMLDDVSGMSRLMPYMTQSEYQKVRDWVNRDVGPGPYTVQAISTRHHHIMKGASILEALSESGRPYTIDRDTYPGQIKATIDGTKTSVRIMDKEGSYNFIGRVYDNGVSFHYSTTRPGAGNKLVLHQPTAQDAVNLVKVALGEAVPRQDDPTKLVGEPDLLGRKRGGKDIRYNASYRNTNRLTMVYGDYVPTGTPEERAKQKSQEQKFKNKVRIVANVENRSERTTPMFTRQEALDYLEETIKRAKAAYWNEVDVEGLITKAREYQEDPNYVPGFSNDPDVAILQDSYWQVLRGERDALLAPGYDGTEDELEYYDTNLVGPEEAVRQHATEKLTFDMGSLELGSDGKRFNPSNVVKWNDSAYGRFRNNDDMVKAIRLAEINPDELRGSDFANNQIKDRLIKFDPTTSRVMRGVKDPYIQTMYQTIKESLRVNGISFNEDDIFLDDQGVVQYQGLLATTEGAGGKTQEVTGTIGQIFAPDAKGVVRTKYLGQENFAFVPGYEATVKQQLEGENKTMEERTLLRGLEQKTQEAIRYQIRQDMLSYDPRHPELGEAYSINSAYRGLYSESYALDYERDFAEQGMRQEDVDAIIKTQSQRVRYPNEIRDGSSIHADFNASRFRDYDYANDNYNDPYILTGNRNISVLSEASDGYFDPIATTATSTNQGAVRYLVESAVVNSDGTITPGSKDDRCTLFKHDIAKFSEYDPFDRQCMMLSNTLQSFAITEPVKTVEMDIGSYTLEDGIAVSKAFAESYKVRRKDGSLRSLTALDKLSDAHGNKGVISVVYDPYESPEDCKERLLASAWQKAGELGLEGAEAEVYVTKQEQKMGPRLALQDWAYANPELEVIMGSHSQLSRFNAGTARELMQNTSKLNTPDGRVIPGAVGEARLIIDKNTVDAKTHLYDEEQVLQGKGRKASGQLAWSLSSKGSEAIMAEFYGPNSENLANAREYMLLMGMDITETGELIVGYQPHPGEDREIFYQPELKLNNYDRVDKAQMRNDFSAELSRRGGFMEVPFQLETLVGTKLLELREGSYQLPVLSAHLRSGQEFEDETSVPHDYTNQYMKIFEASLDYRFNESKLEKGELAKTEAEALLADAKAKAQDAYTSIMRDVEGRKFEGKRNIFREDLMSRRLPNSATAVWGPNPCLDIDEIALGKDVAKTLGVKDEEAILVWRDPVLHASNIRYMKVVIDPEIKGCAINPNSAAPFDGDFDGDTVALVRLNTEDAKKEAEALFSFEANLADIGYKTTIEVDREEFKAIYGYDLDEGVESIEVESYPLNLNDGGDIQVARHAKPELEAQWRKMTLTASKLHESKDLDKKSQQQRLMRDISDFYREAAVEATGKSIISYESPAKHLESVYEANIVTGAKGDMQKFEEYEKCLGLSGVEVKEDGTVSFEKVKDHGSTLMDRETNQGIMIATNVKNVGTGFAGAISQRAVRAVGDLAPEAATELSYPATQAILGSKRDPVDAKRRFELLLGPARKLWSGKAVTLDPKSNTWVTAKEQASPEEWKQSFIDFYTSKQGFSVKINPEHVEALTEALTDDFTGKMKSVETGDNEGVTEGPLLYRLAYGGNLDQVKEAAKNGENLYAGYQTRHFTPYIVRQNQASKAMEDRFDLEGENLGSLSYKAVTKSDTQKGGKAKRTGKAKDVAFSTHSIQGVYEPVRDTDDFEFC